MNPYIGNQKEVHFTVGKYGHLCVFYIDNGGEVFRIAQKKGIVREVIVK